MSHRLLLVSGGGSGTPAPPPGSPTEILAAPEGGWTWFNDPRAIYHDGRTFFGYITGFGHPMAAHYDHGTNDVSTPARLYPPAVFEVDDHDNPGLLRRASDGRLLAFFSTHTGTDQYINVSTNPDDASEWDGPTNIAAALGGTITSYMCPVQLTGETDDPIYIFYRDHFDGIENDPEWAFNVSDDDGATWGSRVSVVRDQGVLTYIKPIVNGTTRIDFVASGHPQHDGQTSIYHFYYEGGAWFKSDGSSAGSLPLEATDMTEVYDGSTTKAWLWDIALDGTDPVIAYAIFPGNDGSVHGYGVARWDGATWETSTVIADAGGTIAEEGAGPNPVEAFYSGGITIDRADTTKVYLSRGSGSDFDIWRYEWDGADWDGGTALTTTGKHMRPVAVPGGGPFEAMWFSGDYESYVDFDAGTDALR